MTYVLNRLLSILLTLFLISLITFGVTSILPGDVATMIMGTQSNPEALAGLREELEAMARARIEETIRRLDLVKREELEAMAELAANERAGQEAAEAQLHDLQQRLAALEVRVSALETPKDAE